MSEIVIYGFGGATYPWSAIFACAEKGVPYSLESPEFKSDEYRGERHPYSKMPALQHGDFKLYETTAIIRYLDAAFEGPALVPSDPVLLGRMEQILSLIKSYAYEDFVPGYLLQYLFPKGENGALDRAAIDEAIPKVTYHLDNLEALIDDAPFAIGETLTMADIFLGPLIHYLDFTPEGGAHLKTLSKLSALLVTLRTRQAFKATMPPPPKLAEAA